MQKNERLKCRLDVYWLLHNFVRVHITTKQVPAVVLGIAPEGFPYRVPARPTYLSFDYFR